MSEERAMLFIAVKERDRDFMIEVMTESNAGQIKIRRSKYEQGLNFTLRLFQSREVTPLTGALEGIRTPNLLIRSQMLYPLSYKRRLRE